jgi:hypothetical protein
MLSGMNLFGASCEKTSKKSGGTSERRGNNSGLQIGLGTALGLISNAASDDDEPDSKTAEIDDKKPEDSGKAFHDKTRDRFIEKLSNLNRRHAETREKRRDADDQGDDKKVKKLDKELDNIEEEIKEQKSKLSFTSKELQKEVNDEVHRLGELERAKSLRKEAEEYRKQAARLASDKIDHTYRAKSNRANAGEFPDGSREQKDLIKQAEEAEKMADNAGKHAASIEKTADQLDKQARDIEAKNQPPQKGSSTST